MDFFLRYKDNQAFWYSFANYCWRVTAACQCKYVAAAAQVGVMKFIMAASFHDSARLRDEIRRCQDLADRNPFGLNISMLPVKTETDRANEYIVIAIDEKICFAEASGRNPKPYLRHFQDNGIKVLHKFPAVSHAISAEAVVLLPWLERNVEGILGPSLIGSMWYKACWLQDQSGSLWLLQEE